MTLIAPPWVRPREAAFDIGCRQALPGSEAPLTQPLVEVNLEPKVLADDLRCLAGAIEIAGIQDVDTLELAGERGCLPAPALVERSVGVALPAAVAVPVGLAVS